MNFCGFAHNGAGRAKESRNSIERNKFFVVYLNSRSTAGREDKRPKETKSLTTAQNKGQNQQQLAPEALPSKI